jgi:hypothetical protein
MQTVLQGRYISWTSPEQYPFLIPITAYLPTTCIPILSKLSYIHTKCISPLPQLSPSSLPSHRHRHGLVGRPSPTPPCSFSNPPSYFLRQRWQLRCKWKHAVPNHRRQPRGLLYSRRVHAPHIMWALHQRWCQEAGLQRVVQSHICRHSPWKKLPVLWIGLLSIS